MLPLFEGVRCLLNDAVDFFLDRHQLVGELAVEVVEDHLLLAQVVDVGAQLAVHCQRAVELGGGLQQATSTTLAQMRAITGQISHVHDNKSSPMNRMGATPFSHKYTMLNAKTVQDRNAYELLKR